MIIKQPDIRIIQSGTTVFSMELNAETPEERVLADVIRGGLIHWLKEIAACSTVVKAAE